MAGGKRAHAGPSFSTSSPPLPPLQHPPRHQPALARMSAPSIELAVMNDASNPSRVARLSSTPSRQENGSLRTEADPLLLRSSIMKDEGMDAIRQRKGKGRSKKKIINFYQEQNEVSTVIGREAASVGTGRA